MRLRFASLRPFGLLAVLPTAFCALTMGSSAARGQAVPTSSRLYNLSGFVTGGLLNTDYAVQDQVVSAGTDLTRHMRMVQPSFEIRGTYSSGDEIRQKTLSAGLKLEKGFAAVHPYADLLYGYGVISYPQNKVYPYDNSGIWTYGGGLDYRVSQSFLLKMEVQQQSWKLGVSTPRFEPTIMAVGFSYRPFMRQEVR